jgi:ferredoxin
MLLTIASQSGIYGWITTGKQREAKREEAMSIKEAIVGYIRDKLALNAQNWNFHAVNVARASRYSRLARHPLLKRFFLKLLKVSDPARHHTQGWIVPIDQGLRFEQDMLDVILPIDLVKKAIKESSFRAIMNQCICRTGQQCKDYPIDFGCIFIGEGSRATIQRGVAREATIEEALEHLDRAAALGLICQCLWVEAERLPLGIHEKDHHKFMEICLCCPCCCLGFRNFSHMPDEFVQRFQSIGWTAGLTSGCSMCGMCIEACPVNARSIEGDRVLASAACFGCGICAAKCPQKAISMQPRGATKERIQDYFTGLNLEI